MTVAVIGSTGALLATGVVYLHQEDRAKRELIRGIENEAKLEAANLWAARVEPITTHHTSTWRELKAKPGREIQVHGSGNLVHNLHAYACAHFSSALIVVLNPPRQSSSTTHRRHP